MTAGDLLPLKSAGETGEDSRPRRSGRHREARLVPILLKGFLLLLAISRYEPTSLVFRGTEVIDFFGWFWRFRLFGALSPVDLALAGLILAAMIFGDRPRPRADGFLPLLAFLVAVGAVVRMLSRGPEDTSQDFFFQLRNYAYLGGIYFVARRIRWSETRLQSILAWIVGLAVVTMALSFAEGLYLPAESRVYKYGRFVSLRDVADYPLILFAQLWLVGLALERVPRSWATRLALWAAIAYSLYGAFTGIGKAVLFFYPVFLAYFVWTYRLYRRVWFSATAALLFLGAAGLVAYLGVRRPEIEETSPLYIYTTFTSGDPSLSTRRTELANFSQNMNHRRGWLWGIGLGTKWREYVDQPQDLAAYPPQERDLGMHLGVHVPFLRLAYDFGLVGCAFLGVFGLVRFRRFRKAVRNLAWRPATRAFLHAAALTIGYQVAVNNLSGPKTNLVAGVLLAALHGALPGRDAVTAVAKPG
jgi:hypothetical protein